VSVSLRPITQREAFAFIKAHHRHHDVPVGAVEVFGAQDDAGTLIGAAVVGRPVARKLDDGLTFEVTRLCTLGHLDACSLLYGAARRYILDTKGGRRGLTYILEDESGKSLEISGYAYLWTTDGGSWDRKGRPREDKHPTCPKHAYGFGAWPQLAAGVERPVRPKPAEAA